MFSVPDHGRSIRSRMNHDTIFPSTIHDESKLRKLAELNAVGWRLDNPLLGATTKTASILRGAGLGIVSQLIVKQLNF
jgi:hypothetical protein